MPEINEAIVATYLAGVKTQGSLPTEEAALVLLFSLVASGQIKLRRIDGWQKIGSMLSQRTVEAAG